MTSYAQNPVFQVIADFTARVEAARTLDVSWDDLSSETQRARLAETQSLLTVAFPLFVDLTVRALTDALADSAPDSWTPQQRELVTNLTVTLEVLYQRDAPEAESDAP